MKITEVRVHRLSGEGEGRLMAFASITIDDCFVIKSLRVMSGQKGLFVAMPFKRLPDGEYIDIAHPITSEAREMLQKVVLEEYAKTA